MGVKAYYRHIRKLGAFRAIDCLVLAREAAALDKASELKKTRLPVAVRAEYAYGAWHRFSLEIKVF